MGSGTALFLGVFFASLRFFSALCVLQGMRQFLGFALTAGVSFLLSLGSLPISLNYLGPAGSSSVLLFWGCVEVLVGVCCALPLAIICEALGVAGRLIDVFRGAQFAEQQLPGMESRVSNFEQAGMLAFFVLFFSMHAYQPFYAALCFLPQHVFRLLSDNSGLGVYARSFLVLSNQVIAWGFCVAGAVILSSSCLDYAGAMLSRQLSQVPVSYEILPVKLILGIIAFSSGLAMYGPILSALSRASLRIFQLIASG